MAVRRVPIEETLRRLGVDDSDLAAVRSAAEKAGVSVRSAAVSASNVDSLMVANALSELSGLPVMTEIDHNALLAELVMPFPLSLARDRGVLPMYMADNELVVGMSDLSGMTSLDDLRVLHGHPVRPVLVPSNVLQDAINAAYDKAAKSASAILDDVEEREEAVDDLSLEDAELLDDPNQAPIIRFVNALLSQAIKERVSDIHIEPFEKDLVVRFRVDGVLHEVHRPPFRLRNPIVSRIKIMAGLNIAEKRLPQDGRISRRMGGREIDLRVSSVPVRHGERVVMRLLEKGTVFSLDGIGMEGDTLVTFRKLIRRPHGILLVTGPTGSGKSTTLYSAISEINSPDKNILTIEDPVEYEVVGIGQVQVNHKIKLTFAAALRSFLRQDPDVILVGEIRDRETAENAVQASLTGHLVFSTLHTNDAAGAFARLTDMGVEPFLVASSLIGVLAQRLVRRLCEECKEPYEPTDAELHDLQLEREELSQATVYRAGGCEKCQNLGYRGRVGIYEFMPAIDEVKQLIMQNADAGSIKKAAADLGMRSLRDDGIVKVKSGLTSFDEVLRVTQVEGVEA
jgi:general secretion pathway protein E